MRLLPLTLFSFLVVVGIRAETLDLGDVPSGVKMVVHFNADAFRNTAVGKFMMQQIDRWDHDGKMDEAVEALGFDPRKDCNAVTMFADTVEEGNGVLLLHGAFNRGKLMGKLIENDTYRSFAYGTSDVHSWIHERRKMYAYMTPDNGVIAMAENKKQLQRTIDTFTGTGKSLAADNSFDLPLPQGDELMYIGGAGFEQMRGLRAQAAVLKQARSALITTREKEGVMTTEMKLVAEDTETAELMLEAINGLIAFARAGAKKDEDALAFLAPLKSASKGDTVSLSIAHESKKMIALFEKRIAAEAERREN